MYQTHILPRVRKQRLMHSVTLELTYHCNLDCFYCYNDRDKPGTPLSLQQYEVLLNDLARMQTMFLMLSGGEPMVHPQFFEIGRIARDLGFVMRIRTNGHSLSSRIAQRLKEEVDPYIVEVSLHGATAEVHDRQTCIPGSFKRLLNNLDNAKQAGLRCAAICTPTSWNEHQVEEMYALCDSLGIFFQFQGPVAPRDNGDTSPLAIQPATETWDKIIEISNRRHEEHPEEDVFISSYSIEPEYGAEEQATCSVGLVGVDIDPYGNVQACMHLQEAAGNLHDDSIEEIWTNSPLFRRARVRSVVAATQFVDQPLKQYGAPLYCLAVEENASKGCGSCGGSCN